MRVTWKVTDGTTVVERSGEVVGWVHRPNDDGLGQLSGWRNGFGTLGIVAVDGGFVEVGIGFLRYTPLDQVKL